MYVIRIALAMFVHAGVGAALGEDEEGLGEELGDEDGSDDVGGVGMSVGLEEDGVGVVEGVSEEDGAAVVGVGDARALSWPIVPFVQYVRRGETPSKTYLEICASARWEKVPWQVSRRWSSSLHAAS